MYDSVSNLDCSLSCNRYPQVCANFTASSSSSSATTQKVFTAIRAARIVARIALALRILRAAVRIAKMARLLGGGKPKSFVGHRQAVLDVLMTNAMTEEEAKLRPTGAYADRYRLFTASADCTVMMYDVLGDQIIGKDLQTASV